MRKGAVITILKNCFCKNHKGSKFCNYYKLLENHFKAHAVGFHLSNLSTVYNIAK